MMSDTLITSKILAAIGSILLCLSFIPILGIIGVILLFSGIKGLAEHYKDSNIYRSAFTGAVFGAICLIILSINEFISIRYTGIFVTDLITRMLNPSSGMFDIQYFIFNNQYFLPFMAIVFIFNLLMTLYFRETFRNLAKRSGERLFNVAGTMMLIGAILTIVLFVGLVLVYIAFIIAAAAFCSIRAGTTPTTATNNYTTPPQQLQTTYYPPPSNEQPTTNNYTTPNQPPITQPTTTPLHLEAKYCPHCGSPLTPRTAFCTQCGKQI
ncbi:MAG: DUF996 domain-containing protein [Candidatus Bathyarchaeota archaeon]|nr:DUF996 domain-containing protein [Candidatus Termiticorpusculum sp.]